MLIVFYVPVYMTSSDFQDKFKPEPESLFLRWNWTARAGQVTELISHSVKSSQLYAVPASLCCFIKYQDFFNISFPKNP